MKIYMKEALKEAKKALKGKCADVPIGAVIIEEGKIIARAHNQKEKKQQATKHAEITAIEKACKKKKSWYLDNCELYVTMEPCLMCCGAIIQSRIKKVVYGTKNDKFGYVESIDKVFEKANNHKPIVESGVCEEECSQIVKDFFETKRK